ncbi:hypothetical protein Cgig2_017541 [Carnegiea gigantea]|uniref:Uncharacterized protein n=1 Tax=Carnegiea gigantea TaxID=171969 RepID=A0A9Q1QLE0_9CARY|nr:hypothetical protein Cgig2_017541 [Carnegiea gigantea]
MPLEELEDEEFFSAYQEEATSPENPEQEASESSKRVVKSSDAILFEWCICIPGGLTVGYLSAGIGYEEPTFSIPNSNYPGPDGYSSGSFNANLNVVGPTVCAAVLELFQTGKLITQLNAVDTQQKFIKRTGFVEGQLPHKYLGLPIASTKISEVDCAKIRIWTSSDISYGLWTDTSCFNIFPPPRHCSNDLVPYHANPHFRVPHQKYWDRTRSPDTNVKSKINVLYDQGKRIEESNQVTANMVNPFKICWVPRILEEINLSIAVLAGYFYKTSHYFKYYRSPMIVLLNVYNVHAV